MGKFECAITTINYLYVILSYFRHKTTNLIAEGTNYRILTAEKMAYRYCSKEHPRTAI
jgi:transposase